MNIALFFLTKNCVLKANNKFFKDCICYFYTFRGRWMDEEIDVKMALENCLKQSPKGKCPISLSNFIRREWTNSDLKVGNAPLISKYFNNDLRKLLQQEPLSKDGIFYYTFAVVLYDKEYSTFWWETKPDGRVGRAG